MLSGTRPDILQNMLTVSCNMTDGEKWRGPDRHDYEIGLYINLLTLNDL